MGRMIGYMDRRFDSVCQGKILKCYLFLLSGIFWDIGVSCIYCFVIEEGEGIVLHDFGIRCRVSSC